jgi:SAM-dependent methyltransferase
MNIPVTERFNNRAEAYARYRPDYPAAALQLIANILPPPATMADIGSGTGILSRQLLEQGFSVIGVEPSEPMRHQAEQGNKALGQITQADGTAEQTGLVEHSVDGIASGQAFHWFRPELARLEFQRILRENGPVFILWNEHGESEFWTAYGKLFERFIPEYSERGQHRHVTPDLVAAFFAPGPIRTEMFPHQQPMTLEKLLGRARSTSYVPAPGQPGHDEIMQALADLFDRYDTDGELVLPYHTRVHIGRFTS